MAVAALAPKDCPRCQRETENFHCYRWTYVFDVDKARNIVKDGREPVEVDDDSIREAVEKCVVDDFHLPHVDPTIPGIIAHVQFVTEQDEVVNGTLMIDGHHRAARCLRDGLVYRAFLLSEAETKAVMLREQGRKVTQETEDERSKLAEKLTDQYSKKFKASAKWSKRARQVIGGAATHDRRGFGPFGVYVAKAEGAWKWDVSGQRLLDCWMGHGSLLMGHSFPPVVEAVRRQMELGTHYGACHELEVRWAELIRKLVPSADRVRFTSSGTEANMLAMRVARAFTGRAKVLFFDGHFHGWHDEAMGYLSSDDDGGFNPGALEHVVRADPDKPDEALERIARGDIAAVMLEPGGGSAGGLPSNPAFLQALREATWEHETLLVFDEVISGFRHSPGGVQAETEVIPDLTTLAKILAGGLPGGAVVGHEDFMAVFGPGTPRLERWAQVPHTGTFNANPLSAAAGIAMLEAIADGAPQQRAVQATNTLVARLNEAAAAHGVDVHFYTNGTSIFHLLIGAYRSESPLGPSKAVHTLYADRPDLYALLRRALLVEGLDCHLIHGWVSALHDDAEVLDLAVRAYDRAFDRLKTLPGFRR